MMKVLNNALIQPLRSAVLSKGFVWFDNNVSYNLNIISVRSERRQAGVYDDYLFVVYRDEFGQWVQNQWPVTTDSGLYYLEHPMNPNGTAILKEGQYRGAYQIGKHQGKYDALVQRKPVKVYRDSNRDQTLDFNPITIESGLFGINIHRSSLTRFPDEIGKWSAGCTVFKYAKHFDDFMSICNKAAKKFGNSFTYTLIEE